MKWNDTTATIEEMKEFSQQMIFIIHVVALFQYKRLCNNHQYQDSARLVTLWKNCDNDWKGRWYPKKIMRYVDTISHER